MAAPSIKEALDNSQSLLVMVNHIGPSQEAWKVEELPKLLVEQITENRTALATLSPPAGERREAIARVFIGTPNPKAVAARLRQYSDLDQVYVEVPNSLLTEAVLILSSGLVQDEAAIRADEREKCAKICDALGDEIMERAEEMHEIEEYGEYESLECAATEYSRAASAIRSARDGGAET